MTRPRHARLPLGLPEVLLGAGVPVLGVLLYLRIRLHTAKRSIPGLLAFGEAGLSESLNAAHAPTRRLLKMLEPRFVLFDRQNRLLYTLGAIEQDGPTTTQAVIAFARQWRELPTQSPVTREVARAITATLADNKYSELRHVWLMESGASTLSDAPHQSGVQSRSDSGLDSTPESGSLPISGIRDPLTEAAAALTADRFRLAWSRLPRPPFAAAAAADVEDAVDQIPITDFDALIEQLASSRWISREGGLNVVPTLRKLLDKPEYSQRIIRGEFASTQLRWRCPECQSDHAPTAQCPPPCRACDRVHPSGYYCVRLKELDYRDECQREHKQTTA